MYIRKLTIKCTIESLEYFVNISRIDACVYINLESRPDRKKHILNEIEKMGFFKRQTYKVSGVPLIKNGHKGCTQSHILALQLAKLNNFEKTLILEDDAKLNISPEWFQEKINKILNYLENKKWDIIVLSQRHAKLENLQDDPNSEIKHLKSSTTTAAYIINNHYLDTLISLLEEGNSKMDYSMWGITENNEKHMIHQVNTIDQIWNRLQKKDNWYAFETELISQGSLYSSIMRSPEVRIKDEDN